MAMAGRLLGALSRRASGLGAPAAGASRAAARSMATKVDDRNIDPEYPDLPAVSAQHRDPFKYWDPQDRRNFGETLHEHDEALSMWLVDDVAAGGTVSPKKQVLELLLAFGALGLLFYAAYTSNPFGKKPVNEKEFPPSDVPEALTGYAGAAKTA